MSALLTLAISVPVFASDETTKLDYEQFKINLLEAELTGNDKLAESISNENPELNKLYLENADVFNSDKVNEKLRNTKLGANDSVLIVMEDNSFVRVTTETRPVLTKNGLISLMGYETDYDLSGTKWSTEFTYKYARNATLVMNTYYQIGRKMNIYQYDTSGTEGSLGISVTAKQSVSGNNTSTATLKGDFTMTIIGGKTAYVTLYTEIGFLKAYVEEPYGYTYVDYYINSYKS